MIIATAGHVDHGKSTLVKALTGVDTDRLPAEKERGLSIELGFAYTQGDADTTSLAFIDVPGHERFIRQMLSGVGAIDRTLLVVAADDGPMPQTREHVAILDLLGIDDAVVAITRTDLVDAARLCKVESDITTLLAGTTLAGAPCLAVCAPAGTGIDRLRRRLGESPRPRPWRTGGFRLAIDRCFTLTGVGLVVTGSVFAGSVGVGEHLTLSPHGTEVRVRSLRADGRAADRAGAGQRCALNIAGSALPDAATIRGGWLLATGMHAPSTRVDVHLRVLAGESRPLRHWTPVHVHAGASRTAGRVAILGAGAIASGDTGLAQLVLERPLACMRGDRVVLRDPAARRTIGGGEVLDPVSPARGRARPQRLAWLQAMQQATPEQALTAALECTDGGIDLQRFRQAWNLAGTDALRVPGTLAVEELEHGIVISATRLQAIAGDVLECVGRSHRQQPDHAGPDLRALRECLPRAVPVTLLDQVLRRLLRDGRLRRLGPALQLPGFRATLTPADEAAFARAQHALAGGDRSAPSLHQAAELLQMEVEALRTVLQRAVRAGLAVQISRNRYLPLSSLRTLAAVVDTLATDGGGGFSVRDFSNAAGVGRNFAVDLLEFFDHTGLTARAGDERRSRRPASEVFGAMT